MIDGKAILKDISPSNDLTRQLLLQLSDLFGLYHFGITNMFLHDTQIRSDDLNETNPLNFFRVYASAHVFYYEYNFGDGHHSNKIEESCTVDELTNMIGEFVLKYKTNKMNFELHTIKEDFKWHLI